MSARPRIRRNANGEGGVYRRADGRWEGKFFVNTPDGRRKRVSVYGDTEREALDELNRLRDQQRRGIPVATTTLTVADYMSYWLEHIAEPSIRRTTYATYEGDVRLHIVPGIGKREAEVIAGGPHREWLTKLRTTCQCCSQGRDAARDRHAVAQAYSRMLNAVLSASSIRHILRVFRAALQDAVDEEMLSRNVASLVQLRVTDERRVRSFSREEALRFLQTAENTPPLCVVGSRPVNGATPWRGPRTCLVRRGPRPGAADCPTSVHRVDGQLRLDPVKTDASVAVLPIPAPLVTILKAHRQRR